MAISLDSELGEQYIAESNANLREIETNLLALDKSGDKEQLGQNQERVNCVFRAVHSIKGGANYFDLQKVQELAHRSEDLLGLIRSGKAVPTQRQIDVLLRARDTLQDMFEDPRHSHEADISAVLCELDRLTSAPASVEAARAGRRLQVLIVEDDFTSRLLLQTFLSRYGDCHIAVNGKEAVEAVGAALAAGRPYDLICMDILMPEMDGNEAVRQVRTLEEARGILSDRGAKIIMTTSVNGVKEMIQSFQALCDVYLFKPIDTGKLLGHLRSFKMVA